MATSKSFFGLRKKSTKSHTYSTYEGKQVTKDRVTEVKNPRTSGQMLQRCVMTTVAAGWKGLKTIVDHSWEGVPYGAKSQNRFFKENTRLLRQYAKEGKGCFNAFGTDNILPVGYIISSGSLPSWTLGGVLQNSTANLDFIIPLYQTKNDTVGLDYDTLCKVLGLVGESYLTALFVVYDITPVNHYSTLHQGITSTLYYIRYRRNSKYSGTFIEADRAIDEYFNIETNYPNLMQGNFLRFWMTDNDENLLFYWGINNDERLFAGSLISSRRTYGVWKRSPERMLFLNHFVTSYDDLKLSSALATYPVGKSYVLNGGV